MKIRMETETDFALVRNIHELAFNGPSEAKLVDVLRNSASPIISMVAEDEKRQLIGHIMFSPVTIPNQQGVKLMGLAPVAITPNEQNRGYGFALIRRGLQECRKQEISAVVVLGHADYYPRFGFSKSTDFNITCEYDVPVENFMALELKENALRGITGQIKYHSAFGEL